MFNMCPGAASIKGAPTLKIKACPECGEEIELFSNEISTHCLKCGFVAYNDSKNCLSWCKYAKECVGEELYNRFMSRNDQPEEEK